MLRTVPIFTIIIFITTSLLLISCLPLPTRSQPLNVPTQTALVSVERIEREIVFIDGYPEAHTPEYLNGSLVSKFSFPQQDTSVDREISSPNTIMIMLPGIYAGATTLEILARQLVARQPSLEIWVADRRSNLLEDMVGIQRSIASQDGLIAYDYYIKNYGKENGFRPVEPDDVAFMRYWDLEVHLKDLHAVIKEARQVADEVYLLGHSLGAGVASFYSSFELDDFGDSGVGHEYINGLILLDGVLGRTGGFDGISWFNGALDIAPSIREDVYEASESSGVTLQEITGFESYIPLLPREYALSATTALLARFTPEELSPLYNFPVTNRAAFGVEADDNFELSTAFAVSVGDVKNASLAGNILPFLLDGDIGAYSKSIDGVAEGADVVSWDSELIGQEVCDIDRFARYHNNEAMNYNEWYFPVALMLDIAGYDINLETADGYIPTAQVTVPTLAIGAERGLVQNLDVFAAYSNVRLGSFISSYIVPDAVHGDVMCAEDNPVTGLVLIWLEQLRTIRNSR